VTAVSGTRITTVRIHDREGDESPEN
jgi:hypothetical protein